MSVVGTEPGERWERVDKIHVSSTGAILKGSGYQRCDFSQCKHPGHDIEQKPIGHQTTRLLSLRDPVKYF